MKRMFFLFFLLVLSSCSLVKKFAGADIDPEQFALARKAQMLKIQSNSIESQFNHLANKNPNLQSDITFKINESFLNKLAVQYKNRTGWLDNETSFVIEDVRITLNFGSAIATISLFAHNKKYNTDVNLVSDCIVHFEKSDSVISTNETPMLKMKLTPYNINVAVESKGIIGYFKEILQNRIKISLANLENSLPAIQIPLSFENKIEIPPINLVNNEKVNFKLTSSKHQIITTTRIDDFLVFDGFVMICANIIKYDIK